MSDARDPAPTDGRLPPSMGRWGMRGMDDLTGEELARLHQKLHGWIRQRAHDPARPAPAMGAAPPQGPFD